MCGIYLTVAATTTTTTVGTEGEAIAIAGNPIITTTTSTVRERAMTTSTGIVCTGFSKDASTATTTTASTTTSATSTTSTPMMIPPKQSPEWLKRRGPDWSGGVVFRTTTTTTTTSPTAHHCDIRSAVGCHTADHDASIVGDIGTYNNTCSYSKTLDTTTLVGDEEEEEEDNDIVVMVVDVTFQSSVLQMRDTLCRQPVPLLPLLHIQNDNHYCDNSYITAATDTAAAAAAAAAPVAYLAWNGEAYQVLYNTTTTTTDSTGRCLHNVNAHTISDTELVAEWMQRQVDFCIPCSGNDSADAVSTTTKMAIIAQQIANVVAMLVNAEFAFCIVTETCAYYGRDTLGRRSLLVASPTVLMSSSSSGATVNTNDQTNISSWQLASVATDIANMEWQEVQPGIVHAYEFHTGKGWAVPWKHHTLPSKNIMATISRTTDTNFTCCPEMLAASWQLQDLLLAAVRRRCHCVDTNNNNTNHQTAVLFSGGLDSVVLAALALQCGVNSLTLLTVSFVDDEKMDVTTTTKTSATTTTAAASADAVAAQQSYQELCTLYPDAKMDWIHRIVPWSAIIAVQPRIRTLLHPQPPTVMNMNIATALWFAASAADASASDNDDNDTDEAITTTTGSNQSSTTRTMVPRILLSGLGADELLGGYGRHRIAWERGGYESLRAELNMDCDRLWERNLGRDDRVLADTGKEARFPFLDATVLQFVRQLPLDCVVDYSLGAGAGDKRILRLVAHRLGLTTAASAVKRAIQFGSRIAHVSDKRRFGSRRKAMGQSAS